MKVLQDAGVSVARYEIADSMDKVLKACKIIGYPVVLKVVSREISHKTEAQAVVVGLKSDDEVKKEAPRLLTMGKVMVQEYKKGVEVIIGAKRDPVFGPVVMFGLGGILVELFKDVSFRVAPIEKDEALDMMKETKGYKLLEGFRGKKANADKVAEVIAKISSYITKNPVEELDINPLMAGEFDAIAVDARVVMR